ncbi:transposase [Wolbachia endosymbiont of Psylliodes chrysocephala]|uniref:transposase n=1 Tax=Wolbachia endosymbiont of Psylliodes chrysocephala TaxID=2883236 RepID=UPI0035161679
MLPLLFSLSRNYTLLAYKPHYHKSISYLIRIIMRRAIILDNATFHKSKKIDDLAKGVGAEILYLPPYSPDFNEIEHQWFAIKNRARKNIPIFRSFRQAVDSAFL